MKNVFNVCGARPSFINNVDSPRAAAKVVDALRLLAGYFPVVLPIHPRTRESFAGVGLLESELRNIRAGTFKRRTVRPLWDDQAAERIVDDVETYLSP